MTHVLPKQPLRGYIKIYAGSAPSQMILKPEGRLPYVKVDDLNNGSKYQIESREYVDDASIVVPKGAILFPKRGAAISNNKVRIAARDLCLDTNVMGVETLDGLDPEYFYYAITHERLYRIADTSTIPQLNNKHLYRCAIWIPTIGAQRKIANVLSQFDEVLAGLSRVVEAKRTYKRGLMQQLFTGKRRFPEFLQSTDRQSGQFGAVPKDWRVVHISEIAEEVKTRGEVDGAVVYSCTKHAGLVPSLEYFGKQVFSRDLKSYKRLQAGDFAYATNHIEEGSIGLLREGQPPGLVSPMYTVFRPTESVNPEFLFALLKTESYRRVFETRMSATVDRRGSLRWNEFSRIKIGLPSIKEQGRIAEALLLADREINQLIQQRKLIEQYKRGLLSKLLSGEIQVPA